MVVIVVIIVPHSLLTKGKNRSSAAHFPLPAVSSYPRLKAFNFTRELMWEFPKIGDPNTVP